ncbi:pilus assembly protein PilP [Undibacterium sp. Jales W-56]|uniref:pilus assembly protein PilP n=1 Tax=Undibacterium sp. Jales W-56 TaxID=2897325 RepID=UPI0021CF7C30|nr:pilus assembly protein PilP [Undibacterium sp. Jales W-56]MCU6432205.1 pilus assembly protein PilP [Undibacterium sp. Jales W-56]
MRGVLKPMILMLMPCFFVTGCSDNGMSEVQEWMAQVKKETRVVISKVSEPKVYVPFTYTGKSDVDPFNPSKLLVVLARLRAESNNGLKPDMERRKEVLESYPLDTLQMVGTIEKPNLRYALIHVSGENKVIQAKMGNYLGQNFGMITKITDNEIEIKEIVQDAAGEWTERQAKLELQEAKK